MLAAGHDHHRAAVPRRARQAARRPVGRAGIGRRQLERAATPRNRHDRGQRLQRRVAVARCLPRRQGRRHEAAPVLDTLSDRGGGLVRQGLVKGPAVEIGDDILVGRGRTGPVVGRLVVDHRDVDPGGLDVAQPRLEVVRRGARVEDDQRPLLPRAVGAPVLAPKRGTVGWADDAVLIGIAVLARAIARAAAPLESKQIVAIDAAASVEIGRTHRQ